MLRTYRIHVEAPDKTLNLTWQDGQGRRTPLTGLEVVGVAVIERLEALVAAVDALREAVLKVKGA